jgi:hypothetical protein
LKHSAPGLVAGAAVLALGITMLQPAQAAISSRTPTKVAGVGVTATLTAETDGVLTGSVHNPPA